MPAANPEKIKIVKDVARREIVFALARVPNSSRVYFGGSDFAVNEADLADDKPLPREIGRHESYVTGLTLALGGKILVSCGYDGRLIFWDTDARSQIRSVKGHDRWVRGVAATPDGSIVASVADDMVARLWNASDGSLKNELRGHAETTPHHFPSMLYAVAITPDGRVVATGDKVGRVILWEIASGRELARLDAPMMYTWDPTARRHSIGGIRSLAFSPDGTQLAVGGIGPIANVDHLDGKARVEVFDWRKGERTLEFPGDTFKGLVERLAFHPSGDWLLAAGGTSDGFFMFLDLSSKKVLAQDKMPMHVHSLALNESGDTIYAAGHQRLTVSKIPT